MVYLVSASADSKTQAAYTIANGDAAAWSREAEEDIDALYSSVSGQAEAALAPDRVRALPLEVRVRWRTSPTTPLIRSELSCRVPIAS